MLRCEIDRTVSILRERERWGERERERERERDLLAAKTIEKEGEISIPYPRP
jgi:hypothetical protein